MTQGTVVRLKSGGPAMTVTNIFDGMAYVAWFDHAVLHRDGFHIGMLVVVE